MVIQLVMIFISITLITAIASTVFILAQKIGYARRDSEVVTAEKKELEAENMEMRAMIEQLEQQLSIESRQQTQRASQDGWEAFDIRKQGV